MRILKSFWRRIKIKERANSNLKESKGKGKVVINLIPIEDEDALIKGSKEFPTLFKECFYEIEEMEFGFEEELNELVEIEFKEHKNLEKLKLEKEKFNILLSGTHLASFYGVKQLCPEVFVQFDFHPDLRDSYKGKKLSHACVAKRIAELGVKIIQIGIGEQSIEDFYNARKYNIKQFARVPKLKEIPNKSIYLSLDADAFKFFGEVSTPSLSKIGEESFEFFETLLGRKEVVGLDLVELIGKKREVLKAAQLIRKLLFFKFSKYKKRV